MFFERRCVLCAGERGPLCASCDADLQGLPVQPGADRRSAVVLDDRARQVVASLKYRRERRLAPAIAARMARITPAGADVITWAPATPGRVRSRGFDQAEEIARALGDRLDIPARRLLRRGRGDSRQTGRTRDERAHGPHVELARWPKLGRTEKRLAVIVDDVVTSGATLKTASSLLYAAGFERVVAVTFAATPAATPELAASRRVGLSSRSFP